MVSAVLMTGIAEDNLGEAQIALLVIFGGGLGTVVALCMLDEWIVRYASKPSGWKIHPGLLIPAGWLLVLAHFW